ncbi:MAG TPA: filamentous hemagglutinin N-terminal domain-containing protein, partial [Oscillatoriaceae cyanobacterium M33_DOE_052]|nr:filamentous hemagglutinin N-terminal domain-containing protein [Oscillatoriaceae cyanobacterium M33_DOE_052]
MKASTLQTLGWLALLTLINTIPTPTTAQPITPAPDGTNTRVNPDGQRYDIDRGTLSRDGSNLFHSFQQFGLNQGETANFITNPQIHNILGRVVGGDPSIINGLIQITGGNSNLFLMNPAGILFGPNASLNIPADFTATTASGIGFSNGWFNGFGSSDYANLVGTPSAFSFNMSQLGTIINEGNLTLTNGSNLNLFANTVINTGTLSTPGGNINISAVPGGNTLRISQPGHILSLEIIPTANHNPSLPELLTGGDPIHHATTVFKQPDGTIILSGSQTPIPNEPGVAVVSGNVDVGGLKPNYELNILGDKIALIGANINASGTNGGGNIHIGGNYQGNGPLPNANHTYIDQNTNISANAISGGKGGEIIIWSDNTTQFHGNISATGIENGGFVEVSGKQNLIFRGNVDLSATSGNNGSLLLDPENITIVDGSGGTDDSQLSDNQILFWDTGTTYTISETALENLNGNAAVELQATNNITIEDLTDNKLTFQSGTGAINFTADADNDGSGAFTMNPGDSISAEGRNITINAGSITLGNIDTSLTSGNGGSVTLNAWNDINTGDICVGCNSQNAANLTINSSNGAINTGKLWAFSFIGNGGAIDLSASGNIQINGDIGSRGNSAGGNINITSNNGDIIHRGRIESFSSGGNAGAVTFNAPGNIHLGEIISYGSSMGGNINITSTAGDIIHLGKLESFSSWGNAGAVTFNAPGNIHLGDINSSGSNMGGNINITSGGDIIHLGKLESFSSGGNAGAVTFNAPGNIYLGDINSSGSSTGGNINITSTSGDIRSGKLESDSSSGNAGSVTFNAVGSIITGDISSAGNNQGGTVTIDTFGTLITGGINSSGASAGSDINLTSINGGITIRNGTLNSSSANGSGGHINLIADTGIITGSVNSTAYSQGGNITLTTTNGDIDTSSGTVNANASNGPNGTITINAPSGSITAGNITGPQNIQIVNGGTDNPNTATPSVSVNSDADMINSNSGLVSLQAHNDITITEPIITNTISHLELKAGRSININADIDTSGSNGDITLQGNHNGADPAYRQSGAGNIIMAPNTNLNAGSGNILVQLGSLGQVGTINLGNINTTGEVSVISPGGNINLSDNQSLINAGIVSFQTYGSGNIGSAAQPIQLNANNLEAIAGSGGAFFQSPNSGVTVGGASSSIMGISASGGPVSLTAIGNIVASEDIWTWVAGGNAGDITIVTSGGGIDTDSSTLSAYSRSGNGGNITLTAPQDINLGLVNSWDQNSTANVNATSGNNINVAGGLSVGRNQSVNLLADNHITISNQANGLFFSFQEYSQGGGIYFTADSDQNGSGDFFTNSDSIIWAKTRDVNISGANVTLGTVVTGIPRGQGGDLNITSENTISTANLDTASADGHAGNINLEVTGSNPGSITTGNLAALTYYQGNGGQVSIDANGGDVNTGNIDTFSNVSSSSYRGGNIDISGGNITAGNINTGNRGAGGAGYGGNINITAVGDMITGAINAAGNMAGGDITLRSTSGSINTSTGFIDSYSGGGTGGEVTVEAERNIATAGVQSYGDNDAGDINMTSNQGTIGAGEIQSYSVQSNAGDVTLNAPNGNIALENIRSQGATIGGDLTINSGGSFTTTGTINSYASASNGVAGNVNITANDSITLGTDASNSALINSEGPQQGGSISITSTSGAIDATTGGLSSFASSGEAGDVTITAPGNISLSNIYSYGATQGGSISITSSGGTIDTSNGILGAYSLFGNGGNITLNANSDVNTGFIRAFASGNNSQSGDVTIISRNGAINTTVGNLSGEAVINADAALADIAGTFLSQFANIDVYAPNGNGGNVILEAPQGITTSHISSYGGINAGSVTATSQAGDISTNVIFSVARGAGDGGNIILAAPNGDISTSHINSYTNGQGAGGAIEITAGGTFNIGLATINSFSENGTGGDVTITANSNIALGGDANRSAIRSQGDQQGGSISITSNNGMISATGGNLDSYSTNGNAGDVTLNAASNIATQNIRSEGDTKGGSIEITTDGTYSGGTINSYASDTATGKAGDVSITANGNITLGGDANNSAIRSQGPQEGGNIDITSNIGQITAAGNFNSFSENGTAGNVSLDAAGNIATQNIRSEGAQVSGNISISTDGSYSGSTINSYATTAATGEAGDVTITAVGNINLGGDASNSAIRSEGTQVGGDISISSNNGTITAGGDLNSFSQNGTAGNVSLDAAIGIDIANIRSEGAQQGGSIEITSDANLDFSQTTLNSYSANGTAGDVTITAAGNINLGGDATNSAIRSEGAQVGGNIDITSDTGTITATGNLNSFSQNGKAGNVTLDAAGNIATQNIRSEGAQVGGNINITGDNGTITAAGDLNSFSQNGTAGNVSLDAAGNVSTNNIRSEGAQVGGNISITSDNGTITAAGDLNSFSQNGTAGNVSLDAVGNIATQNIRSEGAQVGGNIDITSDTGTITATGNLNSFSQNGTAGNVTLDAAGNVST